MLLESQLTTSIKEKARRNERQGGAVATNALLKRLAEPRPLKLLHLTKADNPVCHARLYDARLRSRALFDALIAARTHETGETDVFTLLLKWAENSTPARQPAIYDLMGEWCAFTATPFAVPGVKGVSFETKRACWRARVTSGGKQVLIGRYDTQGAAVLAILQYKHKLIELPASVPKPIETASGREADIRDKYIGVDWYGFGEKFWCLRVPAIYEKQADEYHGELGEFGDGDTQLVTADGVPVNSDTRPMPAKETLFVVFLAYGSRQAAARSYDTFARRYMPTPRLNFPYIGELDAQGMLCLPDKRRDEYARASAAIDNLKPSGLRLLSQHERVSLEKSYERGLLFGRLEGQALASKVLIVDPVAARLLSRFEWRISPRPTFAEGYDPRHGDGYDDFYAGGDEAWCDLVLDLWDRDGSNAIYTKYRNETGHRYLPLEEAVVLAHTGEMPTPGTTRRKNTEGNDYRIENLEWSNSFMSEEARAEFRYRHY